jgi:hypothetical protein
MPCYEVNLISVELKADNIDYLEKALKNLKLINPLHKISEKDIKTGLELTTGDVIDLTNNTITSTSRYRVNEIKREYTKTCVQEVSKKKKWFLKQMADNKFVAKRF